MGTGANRRFGGLVLDMLTTNHTQQKMNWFVFCGNEQYKGGTQRDTREGGGGGGHKSGSQ